MGCCRPGLSAISAAALPGPGLAPVCTGCLENSQLCCRLGLQEANLKLSAGTPGLMLGLELSK